MLTLTWSPVAADPQTIAPTDRAFNGGRPLQLGGGRIQFSSPTLADLDGDAKLEIIVGGSDGVVYAIAPSGQLLWSYQVAKAIDPLVSHPTGTSLIRGAISVADINRDGYNEVVVPVGEIDGRPINGGVVVLDRKGALVPGWPVLTRDHWGETANGYTDGVAASPALGDLDGDGDLEIVAVSFDQQINVWHHDGTRAVGWPQFVRDAQWSPVGLADMDNDGSLEVIALVTTQQEPSYGTVQGGDLRIYRGDGRLVCKYTIDQAFTSAPAIADLDGDGALEIVSGTGDWYSGAGRGWKVYAWDGSCNLRPGWPVTTQNYMTSAPALADLDGDGKLEIVSTSGTLNWSTSDPRVYAWRHDGAVVPGFPATPLTYFGDTSYPLSPVIGDWNADGSPEIFTSLGWEVSALRANGVQYSYWPGGPATNKTFWARYMLNNTPALGDIDGDGRLELVVASVAQEGNPAIGGIFVYESPSAGGRAMWPMLGANPRHDHVYPRTRTDDAVVVRHTIPEIMAPGRSYAATIEIRNTGTSTWTAGEGYYLKGVKSGDALRAAETASLAGAVAPGGVARFTVNLNAPQTPGYYATEWRISRGDTRFGLKVAIEVKVGNEPAYYVLAKDATRNSDRTGIYPGGLARPMPAPADASSWYDNQLWQRAVAFDVLPDSSGYQVATIEGYTTWSAGTPELGRLTYRPESQWTGLRLTPAGVGLFGVNQNGVLRYTEGTELLSGVPIGSERGVTTLPAIPSGQAVDLDVTNDGRGMLVVDRRGHVYAYGNAPTLALPSGLPFPDNEAIAKRIELTPSGRGYYILDSYGRLWKTGDAQAIEAHYRVHMGEDWARDLELTKDGRGYYLLDKEGGIHTGGCAAAPSRNLTPTWPGQDVAVALVVTDSRMTRSLVVSDGQVEVMTPPKTTKTVQVGVETTDAANINWSAASSASWAKLRAASGQTPGTLTVDIQPGSMAIGSYSATITVKDPSGTYPDAAVTVQLRVTAQLYKRMLPLIMR